MAKSLAVSLSLLLALASTDSFAEKTPSKKTAKKKSTKKKSTKKKSTKKSAKKKTGKEEFIQGVRFFKAGEYEAALPLFRKAYELSGHRRSTVLALAQCERVLKLYDDAIAHYREYLAMDPPNAEKIRETIKLTQELLDAMGGTSKPQEVEASASKSDKAEGVDLALKPKPVSPSTQISSSAVSAQSASDSDSILSSGWFWGVTSVVLLGGAAGAYFFWPSPDAYGGTTGVIASPPGG